MLPLLLKASNRHALVWCSFEKVYPGLLLNVMLQGIDCNIGRVSTTWIRIQLWIYMKPCNMSGSAYCGVLYKGTYTLVTLSSSQCWWCFIYQILEYVRELLIFFGAWQLGTHQPLLEVDCRLLRIPTQIRVGTFAPMQMMRHEWSNYIAKLLTLFLTIIGLQLWNAIFWKLLYRL